MGRRFQTFAAIFVMPALSVALAAQVRVDVRLVNITATVTDERGRYISNLTADDFLVEEDGRLQTISHFSQDRDVPVSVGVILDTSGSMERKLRTAASAVDRFAQRINKDDEIFVMTFASEPVLRQDFTTDRSKPFQALRRILATGGTALYDALREGLNKVRFGRHNKRALLVITDGQDTSSYIKLDQVLRIIRESELLVYGLGIAPAPYSRRGSSRRDEVDMNVLRSFAENSGGGAFLLGEGLLGERNTVMDRVLDTVADELRSQYTLGYYPSRPDDGRYHTLRIRTRNGHIVRARRGYFAAGS
jgi:Ca-activated chloride channel family protein